MYFCFIYLSINVLNCLSCELKNTCICFQVKVLCCCCWNNRLGHIVNSTCGNWWNDPGRSQFKSSSSNTHTQVFLSILASNLMSLELFYTFFCSALQLVSGLCWRTEEQQSEDLKLHRFCWSAENFSFRFFSWLLKEKVPLLFLIHHTIIQTVEAGSSAAPICTADLACYPAPPCLTALPWKMCILRVLTWINRL